MSVHKIDGGWVVRWRQGDKNRGRTFKKEIGFRREDAEEFDHKIKRHQRQGGIDPLAAEVEFATAAEDWWLSRRHSVTPATSAAQKSYLEKRILPYFNGYRLCDVGPKALEEFRLALVREEVGAPTQRKILFLIHGIFSHAKRMGYMTYNPVEVIEKPGAYRQRLVQPFPPEKIEAVRGYFLEERDLESATLVSVLAYAGPRPEEAHRLLGWGDIGQTSIIFRASKTEKDRVTRLLEPLAADLREFRGHKTELGPVFGWSSDQFHNWRRRGFKRATKAAGVEGTRPYDLRHAFATLLAAEGHGLDYLARQLGNTIPTCERWYRHLIEDEGEIGNAEERIWSARGGSRKVHQEEATPFPMSSSRQARSRT